MSRRKVSMNPRMLRGAAVGFATARTLLGVVAMATPEQVARPWVGDHGTLPAVHVLGRALGVRDLVLGLGTLRACAAPGEPVRPWIAAGGLADAVDAAATLLAWSSLPRRGRWVVVGAATSGALASTALLCAGLQSPPSRGGGP